MKKKEQPDFEIITRVIGDKVQTDISCDEFNEYVLELLRSHVRLLLANIEIKERDLEDEQH